MQTTMGRVPNQVHNDPTLSPLYVRVEQPYAVGIAQGQSNGRTLPLLQTSQLHRQSGRNDGTGEKHTMEVRGPLPVKV